MADKQGTAEDAVRLAYIRQFQNDVRWIMDDPRGRRFMSWLLWVGGAHRTSFDPHSERMTCFREGARNVALKVSDKVSESAPKSWMKMIEEQANDAAERRRNNSGDGRVADDRNDPYGGAV